jgi:hypothetical protein
MKSACGDLCPTASCITYTSSTGDVSFKCEDNDDNKTILVIIVSLLALLLTITGVIIAIIKFKKKQTIFSTINNKINFDKEVENIVIEVKRKDNDNIIEERQIFSIPDRDYDKHPDSAAHIISRPEDNLRSNIKFDLKQSRPVSEILINDVIKHETNIEHRRISIEASPGRTASPYRKKRSKLTYSMVKKNSTKEEYSFDI